MVHKVGFFVLLISLTAIGDSNPTAKTAIENFYRQYLNHYTSGAKKSESIIRFSKSFQALIDQNKTACDRAAEMGVCGFGAGGDIYLNAQEVDPKINFKNSGFRASEPQRGSVEVNFNVYPSDKDGIDFYQRTILFRMIQEKGQWVVDDILFDKIQSARDQISNEMEKLKAIPKSK